MPGRWFHKWWKTQMLRSWHKARVNRHICLEIYLESLSCDVIRFNSTCISNTLWLWYIIKLQYNFGDRQSQVSSRYAMINLKKKPSYVRVPRNRQGLGEKALPTHFLITWMPYTMKPEKKTEFVPQIDQTCMTKHISCSNDESSDGEKTNQNKMFHRSGPLLKLLRSDSSWYQSP